MTTMIEVIEMTRPIWRCADTTKLLDPGNMAWGDPLDARPVLDGMPTARAVRGILRVMFFSPGDNNPKFYPTAQAQCDAAIFEMVRRANLLQTVCAAVYYAEGVTLTELQGWLAQFRAKGFGAIPMLEIYPHPQDLVSQPAQSVARIMDRVVDRIDELATINETTFGTVRPLYDGNGAWPRPTVEALQVAIDQLHAAHAGILVDAAFGKDRPGGYWTALADYWQMRCALTGSNGPALPRPTVEVPPPAHQPDPVDGDVTMLQIDVGLQTQPFFLSTAGLFLSLSGYIAGDTSDRVSARYESLGRRQRWRMILRDRKFDTGAIVAFQSLTVPEFGLGIINGDEIGLVPFPEAIGFRVQAGPDGRWQFESAGRFIYTDLVEPRWRGVPLILVQKEMVIAVSDAAAAERFGGWNVINAQTGTKVIAGINGGLFGPLTREQRLAFKASFCTHRDRRGRCVFDPFIAALPLSEQIEWIEDKLALGLTHIVVSRGWGYPPYVEQTGIPAGTLSHELFADLIRLLRSHGLVPIIFLPFDQDKHGSDAVIDGRLLDECQAIARNFGRDLVAECLFVLGWETCGSWRARLVHDGLIIMRDVLGHDALIGCHGDDKQRATFASYLGNDPDQRPASDGVTWVTTGYELSRPDDPNSPPKPVGYWIESDDPARGGEADAWSTPGGLAADFYLWQRQHADYKTWFNMDPADATTSIGRLVECWDRFAPAGTYMPLLRRHVREDSDRGRAAPDWMGDSRPRGRIAFIPMELNEYEYVRNEIDDNDVAMAADKIAGLGFTAFGSGLPSV